MSLGNACLKLARGVATSRETLRALLCGIAQFGVCLQASQQLFDAAASVGCVRLCLGWRAF